MAEYTCNVAATSNTSTNTDDIFIELKAAASTTLLLKRVRATSHATTPADNEVQIRVTRNSAATAGSGTAYTPLKRRQSSPAATVTGLVKNGATALALGALTDTPIRASFNQRGAFEWIARDKDDYIECVAAQYIEIVIQCSAASQLISVEIDWEE